MSEIIEKTIKLSQEKIDKIRCYIEDNPIEIYIDYRDGLSDDQVEQILQGKADEVRDEIEMDYECWDNDLSYYKEEMVNDLEISIDEIVEWFDSDDCFYPGYYLSDSGWKQLLRNTSVYIRATVDDASWCFNNWAYGAPIEYTDFKESLKILGVNPREFRELKSGGSQTNGDGKFKGWWPDLPNRTPRVEVKDLFDQMIVLYDGVMNFLLGDLEDVVDVISSDSKNLIFKKGTPMVMYDLWNGAGILDIELTEDLTIQRKKVSFHNDASSKYGIQECYGFVGSYWKEGRVWNGK